MQKYFLICICLFSFLISKENVWADNSRFITVINPVRGQSLNSNLTDFDRQASISANLKLPVTWLVDYDSLSLPRNISRFKSLPKSDEIGLFLEIGERLATDARVSYNLGSGDWARPDKVFLSGYNPADRRRLIDILVRKYQLVFGRKPKSVGAWYIDAYSLDYLWNKYGITAVIDCTDQYTTDKYQLWGKPWGSPYYPSVYNANIPASQIEHKLDIVKTQWALRDPLLAYGATVSASTYSLQANDYVGYHHLNTVYFHGLLSRYLKNDNDFGQATVGLEVGEQGGKYLEEYKNQLSIVKTLMTEENVQIVTMSDFAKWYQNKFKNLNPLTIYSSGDKSFAWWINTSWYRAGLILVNNRLYLRDLRIYNDEYLENDLLVADERPFLYREVPAIVDDLVLRNAKLLIDKIHDYHLERNGSERVIRFISDTKNYRLVINDFGIYLDGKNLVSPEKTPYSLGHELNKLLFHWSTIDWPSFNLPKVVNSYINNSMIVGIWGGGESIWGIRFKPFFWGVLHFPFQTLIRFHAFPNFNFYKILFRSNPQREFDKFMKNNRDKDLLIFRRDETDIQMSMALEESGKVRIFENSLYQIWK